MIIQRVHSLEKFPIWTLGRGGGCNEFLYRGIPTESRRSENAEEGQLILRGLVYLLFKQFTLPSSMLGLCQAFGCSRCGLLHGIDDVSMV